MALVINTNVASLSAQNSMNKAQMEQSTAMERLTTGKRINTAADDAAGIAVANKMTSQVKGLNQAVRNANDGISMIQTASGGLEETSNILQRMRELAVQSSTGTYDEGNRASMQSEIEQLKSELDRISETTTFNGQKILDGSQKDTQIQVGADANQTIDFSIESTAAGRLGSGANGDVVGAGKGLAGFTGLTDDVTINGSKVLQADISAVATSEEALQIFENTVADVDFDMDVMWASNVAGNGKLGDGEKLTFTITELDGGTASFTVTDSDTMEEMVAQINEASFGRVTAGLTDDGRLTIFADNADKVVIADTSAGNVATGAATSTALGSLIMTDSTGDGDVTVAYADIADGAILGLNDSRHGEGTVQSTVATAPGDIDAGEFILNGVALGAYDNSVDYDGNATAADNTDLVAWINSHSAETGVTAAEVDNGGSQVIQLMSTDKSPISIDYHPSSANAYTVLGFEEQNSQDVGGGSVSAINISTADGAQRAIKVLDQAIEQVSEIQGELGAVNNRLDFTVSNLSNVSENAAAAKSRIEDADFAAESANLSRAQVLQQASQAMLAQANAAPKQVMSLLQ